MTASEAAAHTPPRPEAVLRIGVTGHRSLPDADAVARVVTAVLERIGDAADAVARAAPSVFALPAEDRPARLVVVSSLAEGADRIVADAALAGDHELQAVLPFPAPLYRDDFAHEYSRAAFDTLLEKAGALFTLDGTRADAPAAYELAGRVMLANADILIAVWDGEPARGRGGTAEVVGEALASGLPVIVIDPAAPQPRLRWGDFAADLEALDALDGVVRDLLAPPHSIVERPAPAHGVGHVAHAFEAPPTLPEYLAETEQCVYRGVTKTFPWLLSVTFVKSRSERDDGPGPYAARIESDWAAYMAACGAPVPNVRAAIETTLRPAFAYADFLGSYYALYFRGAYIRGFSLAALAVIVALIAVLLEPMFIDPILGGLRRVIAIEATADGVASWTKIVLVAVELVILLTVIIFVRRSRKLRVHRKWLAYRELAELLRPMRALALIAASGPTPRPLRGAADIAPIHDDPSGPASFAAWYAHAVRRMLPVPDAVADRDYFNAVICAAGDAQQHAMAVSEIENQIAYNNLTSERMQKLDHRLHVASFTCFWLSVAVCVAFLAIAIEGKILHVYWLPQVTFYAAKPWATFFAAALPTVGAALLAIRVQGDFATVARRTRRTAAELAAIRQALLSGPRTVAAVSTRLSEAAAAMAADVEDWQRLSRTRPLQDP